MLNILRAELYHVYRQKGNYILAFLGFVAILTGAFFMSPLKGSASYSAGYFYAETYQLGLGFLSILTLACLLLLHKRKNIRAQLISQGQRRWKLYLGDYLVLAIQLLVLAAFFCLISLVVARVFFGVWDDTVSGVMGSGQGTRLQDFLKGILGIYGIGLAYAFSALAIFYLARNIGVAALLFICTQLLLPQIFMIFQRYETPVSDLLGKLVKFFPHYFTSWGNVFSLDFLCMFLLNLLLWSGLGLGYFERQDL